jgi:hypothetical protein
MTGCVDIETRRAIVEVAWENYSPDGVVRISIFESQRDWSSAFASLNRVELDQLIRALQDKRATLEAQSAPA